MMNKNPLIYACLYFCWIVVLQTHNASCSGQEPVASKKPLKVFILAGQSNMQGHAHVRTFEHIGMDPKTAPLLELMQNADGQPRVYPRVSISAVGLDRDPSLEVFGPLTAGFGARGGGVKIGPEFTFGIFMQRLLDEPILIIKTSWGGKSLNTDFRPPSAGPYQFNESQLETFNKQNKNLEAIRAEKKNATGRFYRMMLEHVNRVLQDIRRVNPNYDPDQGYELAGFVWFQGWNDMVDRGTYPQRDQPGGYDQYSQLLAHFIRDIRRDLTAPNLPFVIGVMGAGGPVDKYLPSQKRYRKVHQNFRNAMAAPAKLPEFEANVTAVFTEKYWDLQLTALRARDAQVRQELRKLRTENKFTQQQERTKLEEMRGAEFSKQELQILEKGVSNQEYHYLGSAKIMAGIGKGFAESMHQLMRVGPE